MRTLLPLSTRGATSHFDLPRSKEGEMTAPYFGRVEAAKKTLASEKPITTVYKPIEKKGKK